MSSLPVTDVPLPRSSPIDEYEGLEETAEILSDPSAVRAIQRGLADLKAGRLATLDEVQADVAKRKNKRRG